MAKKYTDDKIKEFGLRLQRAQTRLSVLKKEGASQERINIVDAQVRRTQAAMKKMRAEPMRIPDGKGGRTHREGTYSGGGKLSEREKKDFETARQRQADSEKASRKKIMRGENFTSDKADKKKGGPSNPASWKTTNAGAGDAQRAYYDNKDPKMAAKRAARDKRLADLMPTGMTKTTYKNKPPRGIGPLMGGKK